MHHVHNQDHRQQHFMQEVVPRCVPVRVVDRLKYSSVWGPRVRQAKKDIRRAGSPAPLSPQDRYVRPQKHLDPTLHYLETIITRLCRKWRAEAVKLCSFLEVSGTGMKWRYPLFFLAQFMLKQLITHAHRHESSRNTCCTGSRSFVLAFLDDLTRVGKLVLMYPSRWRPKCGMASL